MPSLALEPNCRADRTLESLQQRAMKIIFPAVKDYTLSLIFANVDTLESRREQLTERLTDLADLRKTERIFRAAQSYVNPLNPSTAQSAAHAVTQGCQH